MASLIVQGRYKTIREKDLAWSNTVCTIPDSKQAERSSLVLISDHVMNSAGSLELWTMVRSDIGNCRERCCPKH